MDKITRNPTFIFFLILATLAAGVVLLLMRPAWRDSDGPITSAERAAELAKQGMREQIVSFGNGLIALPELAAPSKLAGETNLFAVPVGQITLNEPETRFSAPVVLKSYRGFRSDGSYPMYDSVALSGVRGAFNNVLIYDRRTGAVTRVFETRIAISMFKHLNQVTPRVIAFSGTAHDSDKDGRLDRNDMQQLFIYTLDDGRLHEVTGLDASVDDIESVNGVGYLVVVATVDRNKDGTPEQGGYRGKMAEPRLLYRVDLQTFAASPLVDGGLVADLQATLDGTKTVVTK